MTATDQLPWADPADWKSRAVCHGKLHLFFAKKSERPEARARREAKAKRLCDVCPVMDECRQYARDNRLYGFWGGESEEARHRAGYTLNAPIGVRPTEDGESVAS
ncbi:MAG: WhiB family transcriptional regulator [Ilumatobacter sp.]|uniref:WhiB family transcriptional regulator n=1 Tax=Ilumatobacter sp. TaxID=1967498 RepID=UPI002621A0F7|nr:WhiB family transcriptional regulator [Ilumatobacter sp.]MDJ0769637.1 WhiB family transcriptional regulator [Ilumatobacter sp.]